MRFEDSTNWHLSAVRNGHDHSLSQHLLVLFIKIRILQLSNNDEYLDMLLASYSTNLGQQDGSVDLILMLASRCFF